MLKEDPMAPQNDNAHGYACALWLPSCQGWEFLIPQGLQETGLSIEIHEEIRTGREKGPLKLRDPEQARAHFYGGGA